MNYLNEFEWSPELANENPELELENYAGKIWEIAKQVHQAPPASSLKNKYIAAAKVFGRQLVPGAPGGMPRSHAGRRIHFYRKVIRNAANYLNRALRAGHQGHPGPMVKQAFNRASKMVAAQTGTPAAAAPKFANAPAASITSGPYQQTPARGTYGTSYTSGPAPAATGLGYRPANSMPGVYKGNGNGYPSKRGKLWTGGGAFHAGATSGTGTSSSQNQGRWTKKGNTLILHG